MGVKGEETRAILLALLRAKQGAGGLLHFLETNCKKKRLRRSLPEQNPGLRKIVGIQERKCRVIGKGYHTNTASCKEELDPRSCTAPETSASIARHLL